VVTAKAKYGDYDCAGKKNRKYGGRMPEKGGQTE
jgi:hypothetical protein